MSDELFEIEEESLSPREKWIRKHDITVGTVQIGGATNHLAAYKDLAESALTKDEALHRLATKMAHFHSIEWWGASQ